MINISDIFSQNSQSIITGHIFDDDKNNLPYSSVCILNPKDSSIIKGTISDSSGVFTLTDISKGKYILYTSYLGYDKYFVHVNVNTNKLIIDTIYLKKSGKMLNEVKVYATKKIIEKIPDGFLFRVENSITASNGTALDALGKAPGVFINQQNGISLKGKSDITILIDGKPTNLSGEEELNYLKNLNAENISKIKIMTNPSSKYDAEGSGIIDIITKKNKNYGLNGTLKYGYALGEYSTQKPGFDFNYRNGLINIYGNYTYGNGKTLKDETENIFYGNNVQYEQLSNILKKQITNIYRAGIDFTLNENNILGLMVDGYQYNNSINNLTNTNIDSVNSLVNKINTNNKLNDKTNDVSFNLNYKWTIDTLGKELSVDIDYGTYHSPETQNITNDIFDKNNVFLYSLDPSAGNALQDVIIKTAKTDFSCPINEVIKFELGGKISSINTDNNISFYNISNGVPIIDSTISNHYKYGENIQAFYGNFSYSKEKFNFQIGIRYENTQTSGNSLTLNSNVKNNYYKLFPSCNLEYVINDNQQLDLSYSSRIARPGYWELNPFRWYINPYSYIEGNPFLQSSYINSIEFSYTFLQKYTLTTFFEEASKPFTQIPEQDNLKKIIRFVQVNLDENINYGISLTLPFSPFKWWESSNTLNFLEQHDKSKYLSNSFNYQKLAIDIQTTNTITILREQKLYFELSSYYTSPRFQGLFQIGNTFDLSCGIKKIFLKNKGTISLLYSDIFNTNSPTAKVSYFDQNSSYKFKLDTRIFRINLSYKFGNSSLKSVRTRQSGNEDELKRLENKNK